jgi:hypothetical protein
MGEGRVRGGFWYTGLGAVDGTKAPDVGFEWIHLSIALPGPTKCPPLKELSRIVGRNGPKGI